MTDATKLRKVQTWDEWRGPTTQKDLLDLINKERISRIQPPNEREKLYRASQATPGAKDWLKCRPSKSLLTYISNRDYRAWFTFYCRRPLANPKTICLLVKCTKEIDTYKNHLLHCKYSARSTFSPMIRRHDAQFRLLVNDLRTAIRNPILELRDHTPTHHVRPDIMALGAQGEKRSSISHSATTLQTLRIEGV